MYNTNLTDSPQGGGTSVYVRPVQEGFNLVDLMFFDTGFEEEVEWPFFERGGRAFMRVQPELFERMMATEMEGIEVLEENLLYITSNEAVVRKLELEGEDNFWIEMIFDLEEIQEGEEVVFDVVQRNSETQRFEGGERFLLRAEGDRREERQAPAGNILATGVNIYPNPAKESIQISGLDKFGVTTLSIDIVNPLGHSLNTVILTDNQQPVVDLNISEYPQGWYIIRISSGDEVVSKHLVKIE